MPVGTLSANPFVAIIASVTDGEKTWFWAMAAGLVRPAAVFTPSALISCLNPAKKMIYF